MSQREQFLVRRRCLGSLFPRNFVQSDKYFHKLRIWVVHRYDHMGFSYFSLDTVLVHSVSVWLRNIKSMGLKLRCLINNWTIIVCFIGVVFSTTGLEVIIFFSLKVIRLLFSKQIVFSSIWCIILVRNQLAPWVILEFWKCCFYKLFIFIWKIYWF